MSEATPRCDGLEKTVCGLFNHAELGEVRGSASGNDLWRDETSKHAEPCAWFGLRDKHPGKGLLPQQKRKVELESFELNVLWFLITTVMKTLSF